MISQNISLKDYSNYRIGGIAKFFSVIKDIDELVKDLKIANQTNSPIYVLGAGTNLLIDDGLINGFIIKPEIKYIEEEACGLLRVGSGVLMSDIVESAIRNSLTGIEWAAGLPGTLGGAIYGNAGAFGLEMKDIVVEVESLKFVAGEATRLKRDNSECRFGYRNSVFKESCPTSGALPSAKTSQEIIVGATLKLAKGNKKEIFEKTQEKINYRKERQPLEYPSIGSIFKNIPWDEVPKSAQLKFGDKMKTDPFRVLPAAVLIANSGLQGSQIGGAQISTKHSNFIVNINNARTADVLGLIDLAKMTIKKEYGIILEEEVVYWR